MRNAPPAFVALPRQSYTIAQKLRLLQEFRKVGGKQAAFAAKHKMPQQTLSTRPKEEKHLLTLKARGFGKFKKVKPVEKFKKDSTSSTASSSQCVKFGRPSIPSGCAPGFATRIQSFSIQSLRQYRGLTRFRRFYGLAVRRHSGFTQLRDADEREAAHIADVRRRDPVAPTSVVPKGEKRLRVRR
jgi:hypothetical protein